MVIHREQFTEITEGVDSLDNESNRDEISYDLRSLCNPLIKDYML